MKMPPISIPKRVLPGFKEIAKLSKEQAEKFASYLKDIPVGIKFNDINEPPFDFSKFAKPEAYIKSTPAFV